MSDGKTKRPRLSLLDVSAEAGKLPPQVPEMEVAVLGAVMLEKGTFDEVSTLQADQFYVHAHAKIWEAIIQVYNSGAHPDIQLVAQQMKVNGTLEEAGGPYYISTLTNKVSNTANVEYHAAIIRQTWMKREEIRLSMDVMKEAYDDTTDVFEVAQKLQEGLDGMMERVAGQRTVEIKVLADEQLRKMDEPRKEAHTSGFRSVDNITNGGFVPGDLWTVAARPGMGKSAWMETSLMNSAKVGRRSAVWQAELSERVFNNRLVSMDTGIPLASLMSGRLTEHEMQQRHQFHDAYSKLPIWVNFSSAPTILDIRAETAALIRKHQITALYIDQANWVKGDIRKQDMNEFVSITRPLRRMAKDFDITVILLHQMNREVAKRTGHKPQLSDLKGSGSFEEDSQVVMFINRPEYYGTAEDEYGSTRYRADLIFEKQSNGPCKTIHVRFEGETASFHDDWGPPLEPPTTGAPADAFTTPTSDDDFPI